MNIERLVKDSDTEKQTKFIEISNSDIDKNNLKVRNALKDVEISQDLNLDIERFLKNPHAIPSIGLFIEEGNVIDVQPIRYPYEEEFNFTKFYTLPFFDYRNQIFESLYLLKFSKKEISLFKLGYNEVQEMDSSFETYDEYIENRVENKSIQRHGGDQGGFHGQNATTEKDRESSIVSTYISGISEELKTVLEKLDSPKLIIMGTKEHIDAFKKDIPDKFLTSLHLEGNFNHLEKNEISEKVRSLIEANQHSIFKDHLEKDIDQSQSNELQSKDFSHILSFVKEGKIESIFIGELGGDDADYENPVAPAGANYISQEVLKLGGNVHYFPDSNFEFTENNIAFKFRYN